MDKFFFFFFFLIVAGMYNQASVWTGKYGLMFLWKVNYVGCERRQSKSAGITVYTVAQVPVIEIFFLFHLESFLEQIYTKNEI